MYRFYSKFCGKVNIFFNINIFVLFIVEGLFFMSWLKRFFVEREKYKILIFIL